MLDKLVKFAYLCGVFKTLHLITNFDMETNVNNTTENPQHDAKLHVMRSLLLKYQEEWKKSKANSKRTTEGGYEKVDLKEWGKMEAFAMIMDDLARLQ